MELLSAGHTDWWVFPYGISTEGPETDVVAMLIEERIMVRISLRSAHRGRVWVGCICNLIPVLRARLMDVCSSSPLSCRKHICRTVAYWAGIEELVHNGTTL